VRVTMISEDVLHAFYIPAFRVQMHVVPGRYTQLWFTPTAVGEYHLFCAMYCGTQHSEMGGKVVVMPQAEYSSWLANGGESEPALTMAQQGARIYDRMGCQNCHGAEDTPRAPSLYGLLGRRVTFDNGGAMVADEDYIRNAILRPYDHLVAGYDKTMPTYDGQLSEDEVLNLIAYIKALGSGAQVPPASVVDTQQANNVAAGGGYATSASKPNVSSPFAVGALREEQPSREVTPTDRTKSPAVGAIAAEGNG